MNTMTDGLMSQLQGAPMAQIGQQLGLSPQQAQQAVSTALPLLMGALGRNAQQPQGAQSLFGALQKDHQGLDLGGVLGSVLGGGGKGGSILGHVFGNRQPVADAGLGQATGLGQDKANMLLKILAPLVLAYLAKRMFDRRRDAAAQSMPAPAADRGDGGVFDRDPTPEVLREELGREEAEVVQRDAGIGGLLGAVLDRNRDGKVDVRDLVGAIPPRR